MLLEIIAMLVDELVVGNLFDDAAFASINLIEPYSLFEVFIAYLVTVAAAALIVRAHGAGDHKRMSELFSQTTIVCGLVGIGLTLIYVLFTPSLVRFVADDPAVYDNALAYFNAMRFTAGRISHQTHISAYQKARAEVQVVSERPRSA